MIELPHLETNITTVCQLSCRDCNHFIPLQGASFIEPEPFYQDLKTLSKIAKAKAYALIGGEPLTHKGIDELIHLAKFSGISEVIEVWTNGILIHRTSETFWKKIDRLVVSLYKGKEIDLDYIQEKCKQYHVELELKRYAPFTNVLHKERDPGRAVQKWAACWYRKNVHVVEHGFFYRCCTSPFIPKLIYGDPPGTDGLPLEGITEEKLREFLNKSTPMKSCEVCGGHNGIRREWTEVPRSEWKSLTEI